MLKDGDAVGFIHFSNSIYFYCIVSLPLYQEIPVSTAAWLTLSACDLNDLLLSDIPDEVSNWMNGCLLLTECVYVHCGMHYKYIGVAG